MMGRKVMTNRTGQDAGKPVLPTTAPQVAGPDPADVEIGVMLATFFLVFLGGGTALLALSLWLLISHNTPVPFVGAGILLGAGCYFVSALIAAWVVAVIWPIPGSEV